MGQVILQGSFREHLDEAQPLSELEGSQHRTITLILRGGAEVAETHAGKRYGIAAEDIELIEKWAQKNSFSVDKVHVEGRYIKISGELNCLAQAFQANLEKLHDVTTRTGHIMLDKELDGVVISVLGFDQRPQAQTRHRVFNHATTPVSYTPPQVAKAYNYPSTKGAGQTIGILELGGGFQQSDLTAYWSKIGVAPVSVTAVGVDGATNNPTGNPNSADGEVALDIQVAGGMAPLAKIVVYFAPNTDQGFFDGIAAMIHDTVRKPKVCSISWGSAEANWTPQAMTAIQGLLNDAGLMGITVCIASGDNGADDGVGDGNNHVDFPASAWSALACGGTSLTLNHNGAITSETVWNDGANGGASGGGVSSAFIRPSWYQSGIKEPGSGRCVPDVAGVADPQTGYEVIIDGQSAVVGGTSAVAPQWAALIALCNEHLKYSAGWIHQIIYRAPANSGVFRDIVAGNNGVPGLTAGYPAGPGYDLCTGWGSPNGQNLLALLQKTRGAK